MMKFMKRISVLLVVLFFTTTMCYATDINMNLQQSDDDYLNSITNSNSNQSNYTTTVSGQSTNSSTNNSEELGMGNILNILLIVVGVVLILLGIAILIRIHGK